MKLRISAFFLSLAAVTVMLFVIIVQDAVISQQSTLIRAMKSNPACMAGKPVHVSEN